MILIRHRINTAEQLRSIPSDCGVEMDLHAYADRLVVHHDPMVEGEPFEEWLRHYKHRFLIANIKEEGIEDLVLDQLQARGIKEFFLLDLSFPALMKLVRKGETRIALRVSAYERLESALCLAGKVQWVWLDLFENKLPLGRSKLDRLREASFRLCLVSPELHGRSESEILPIQKQLRDCSIEPDAVCTKFPAFWTSN